MKPAIQKSLTERANRQSRALHVMELAATGVSLSAAAKESGITTSSAIEIVQEVLRSVLQSERWGATAGVQTALRKTLLQVFSEHYELVDEIVANLRKELDCGSLTHWKHGPDRLESAPRNKKRPVTIVVWTEAMQVRLGKDTDVNIANELGLTCRLVQQRRKTLGIDSFRSVHHTQALRNNTFIRDKADFALASVWMGRTAEPYKDEPTYKDRTPCVF